MRVRRVDVVLVIEAGVHERVLRPSCCGRLQCWIDMCRVFKKLRKFDRSLRVALEESCEKDSILADDIKQAKLLLNARRN